MFCVQSSHSYCAFRLWMCLQWSVHLPPRVLAFSSQSLTQDQIPRDLIAVPFVYFTCLSAFLSFILSCKPTLSSDFSGQLIYRCIRPILVCWWAPTCLQTHLSRLRRNVTFSIKCLCVTAVDSGNSQAWVQILALSGIRHENPVVFIISMS